MGRRRHAPFQGGSQALHRSSRQVSELAFRFYHKRDAARAEDALTLSYGSELIGMQRDWNEELQSCREFPHTNLQERVLRDRALYKVTCDFVDAAINGAIGVISRCIPPINPTDPECFHMYVHNNIFFSFAVDADLGLVLKDHHENTISLPNTSAKAPSVASHATSGGPDVCISDSPKASDIGDVADVSSSTTAEAQLADSEQATYASANNDLKGTKAYQEADVPGLHNLAMAIIDYRGHRVVAQSIIPGILQGDKSDSLLYGSVDNGKKICWNESFHSKVLEAAKRLHLKEHTVLDGFGNVVKLAAPVECKGIVGSDDRHYLLDLMRVTPRDANYNGPGSRFCVLRLELITSFCQAEAAESSCPQNETGDVLGAVDSENSTASAMEPPMQDHREAGEECTSTVAQSSKSCQEVLLNPNVFTEFKLARTVEEIAADEASVRKVSLYLMDVVLPKFVQDLCSLEVSQMDGQTLTDALHAHGINIRYLGKVADMTKHLPHLWDLCTTEIVIRSTKHILKDTLRESQDHDLGPAISHFFNCFFGNVPKGATSSTQSKSQKKDHSNHQNLRKSGKGQTKSGQETSRTNQSAYLSLTSVGLWSHIEEFARFKYQFELPEDARLRVRKVSVLRNLCQKISEFLRMAEIKNAVKKWEDMETDVLVKIFKELNLIEMAPVSQVCRSWRLACSDPWLWNTLDLGLLKSNFIQTRASPYIWVDDRSDRKLTKLLRLAMAVSRGNITCLIFHFNLYMKDDHLSYIAERCPNLKRFVLPAWNRITKTGICQAIRRWQDLESMTMPSIAHPPYIMEERSRSCKNFSSLKIMGTFDVHFASTIASHLPKLKILSVRCSIITREALLFILDCMDHLEVLNISHCLLLENLTTMGRKQIIRELDHSIVEKTSRLREFYQCMSQSCGTCQRMTTDEGLMRWYRYEDWFWREDEVSSLSLGQDYGKLFDEGCLNLGFRN